MKSPFPGMDPYLEHPSLWPDVHNRLIAAIADALVPLVAPRYFVALERRAYLRQADDLALIGRPDLAVVKPQPWVSLSEPRPVYGGVLEVEVPMSDEVREDYLEVHEVKSGRLITLVELLSPTNKLDPDGRWHYERKRTQILNSLTSLVEIDLLRAGEPMPTFGRPAECDYRILISRGWQRPRSHLYPFDLRQPIPSIPVPLQQGETEPVLDLNEVLHALYTRARFDLRLDYAQPPVPPLSEEDAAWAQGLC